MAVTIAEGRDTVAEDHPQRTVTELERVATWRCDRRRRNFTATSADGRDRDHPRAHPVVRPPARDRGAAPHAGAARRALPDRRPLAARRPRPAAVRRAARRAGPLPPAARAGAGPRGSFRPLRAGAWRISLSGPGLDSARSVRVSAPDGRLDVLATGDSMIQIIDGFLKARLARVGARVRSDAHIATGISDSTLLNWQKQARRQAAREPDVVVMFLGANDGFPMAGAAVLRQPAWIAEYARRARRMMHAYGRGGRARVLWLTLPAPRGGIFTETFPAVNKGIRAAGGPLAADVRLIDLFEVFTPGRRYRESMRDRRPGGAGAAGRRRAPERRGRVARART